MAHKNYVKGRRLEYDCMDYLKGKGYYTIRSYGSHGVFDIIAIPPTNDKGIFNYPLLIQCKTNNYLSPLERMTLQKSSEIYQGWVVICYRDRGVKFRSLNGDKIVSI